MWHNNCPYHDMLEGKPKKQYQLVIMHEDGQTYFCGKLYGWDGIQEAVKEVRELYEKHGVTHHVGFKEV